MDLFNVTTRRKDTIDDPEALQQALVSGTHAFSRGSSVTGKSPNGQMGTIPAENIIEAIKAGYQVETNSQRAVREYVDENQGIKGALKVGLGQFADEALLGLPELIYNRTGDPLEVAKKNALKEEFGLANALGGISGFGASLLTGPGAVIARLGTKGGEKVAGHIAKKLAIETGEQVGKRTLSKAAGGIAAKIAGTATEGAIVTTPYAITEAALGDPEAAANTMLAGVGFGALFGGAQGLGKEFLGLGKKVTNETARLVGETDLTAKKLARRAATVVTGVDEDDILYYMKNSDKVNSAPAFENLKDDIDRVYKELDDKATFTREALRDTDIKLESAYKNIQRDMAQTRAPQELADELVASLDNQKAVLGQMSAEADDILADSSGFLPKKKIIRMIDKVQESVVPFEIGEKATQTATKLNTLKRNIDDQFPSNLEMTEVREIIRQVRDDINYNQLAGEFNDRANKARKAFTKSVSDAVKKQVPEYAEQMALMERRASVLEKMSKTFGERQRAATALTGMLKPGQEVRRELLDEFSAVTGEDFSKRFGELVKVKDQLNAIKKGDDLRPQLLPNLFREKQELEIAARNAKETLDSLRKISPVSSEKAIRRMGWKNPDIETRRAFERLSELSGTDYLDLIKDRNILDAFDKASTQGARKVNAAAIIFGGLGGAAGLGVGGPLGAIAGAAAGSTLDVYGGQLLKSLMDRAPNFTGLMFVEKGMKRTADEVDRIPGIIRRMMSGKKDIKKSTAAIDALFRLTREEPPTKKEKENPGEQLEKLGEKLRTWLADPTMFNDMIGKFTTPLAEGGAPNIAEGLTIGAQKALSYLQQEIPKPPTPSSPFAPKITWNPSDYELSKFTQILEVAENPFVVLDLLEAGTLTSNHMDALKTMFPPVYEAMQKKVIETATNNPEPMSYADRVKLSILADMPLDETVKDEHILKLQSKFMNEQPEQQDLEEQAFSPSQDIKIAKSNLTTMQSAVMQ